jgi:thioredoxin-dependent peroxiredoxin
MRLLLVLFAVVLVVTATTAAVQNPVELKVGDLAPDFALPGSDGKTHRLSEYKGKAVVIAWFPRAFTAG